MKPRHEFKYIINRSAYHTIRERLKSIAKHDRNADEDGFYYIRSLYFDDHNKSGYFDKADGIDKRRKYRARIYDTKAKTVNLEIKEKLDNLIRKISARVTREDYQKLLDEGMLDIKRKNDVATKFEYMIKKFYLKPSVIIDYKREAFIYPYERTRITFDVDIKFSYTQDYDIFNGNIPMFRVFDEDYVILEVKYDKMFAGIIRNIIQVDGCNRLSVSKYALSQEKKGSLLWNG
jgi:hypothetical protein